MDDEYGENLVKAYICVIKSLVSRCEDVAVHNLIDWIEIKP